MIVIDVVVLVILAWYLWGRPTDARAIRTWDYYAHDRSEPRLDARTCGRWDIPVLSADGSIVTTWDRWDHTRCDRGLDAARTLVFCSTKNV